MNQNAGASDILDRLLDSFANNTTIASPTRRSAIVTENAANLTATTKQQQAANGMTLSATKGTKAGTGAMNGSPVRGGNNAAANSAGGRGAKTKKPPAVFRSRINEYFRMTVTGRDL